MDFEGLIGNEETKVVLKNIIQQNKIMHSYLFTGPSGIGKTLFAKQFAKRILCLNNKLPCNECKSCLEIQNNNHPDFILISPNDGTIKIEQIRELVEKSIEKPIISSRKVYIIKNADLMTNEASNCLLKILEEPPSFITIIMIAQNESVLLNTIKSRCTKINFKRIENNILKEHIEKTYNIKASENLLKSYGGSIEKAIHINENLELYTNIEKIFSNIQNYKLISAIKELQCIYDNKEIIYEILDYINSILINGAIKNTENIKYIQAVEEIRKKLKQNSNFDMSIDYMIYKIWEE